MTDFKSAQKRVGLQLISRRERAIAAFGTSRTFLPRSDQEELLCKVIYSYIGSPLPRKLTLWQKYTKGPTYFITKHPRYNNLTISNAHIVRLTFLTKFNNLLSSIKSTIKSHITRYKAIKALKGK